MYQFALINGSFIIFLFAKYDLSMDWKHTVVMMASTGIKPWYHEINNAYLVDSFIASETGDNE